MFSGTQWVWFAAAAGTLVWAASGIGPIIIPVDKPEDLKASLAEDDERRHEDGKFLLADRGLKYATIRWCGAE